MSPVLEKARGGAEFSAASGYSRPATASTNGVYFSKPISADERQWAEQFKLLETFRALEDDWDGDGSVAPGRELAEGARSFAVRLRDAGEFPPDRIVAGVNGTIIFEWHLPFGYREIEVDSPISAEVRWVAEGSDKVEVDRWRIDE